MAYGATLVDARNTTVGTRDRRSQSDAAEAVAGARDLGTHRDLWITAGNTQRNVAARIVAVAKPCASASSERARPWDAAAQD